MTKKVFITGGTGFLGCYLARHFLKEDYTVCLFDLSPLDAKDLKGKVTVIQGDIRDARAVEKAMGDSEYVIHAAAALPIQRSKKAIYSVNVDGTRNVLEAALTQHVKRVVFISSTAVCGVPKVLPENEDSPLHPIGYYGESKIIGEKLCHEYGLKGLSYNTIRPKSFLGPERLGVFEVWFEAIYTGKRVYILGNGKNKYQLLDVRDVVTAVSKALTSSVDKEIFTIGARDYQTWRKDIGSVIKYEKSSSRITSLPVVPSQILLAVLDKLRLSPIAPWHYKSLPVDSYVSNEKTKKLLGFEPTRSNRELLLDSYLWYKKNRKRLLKQKGKTHRVGWNFKILNVLSKF